MSASLWRLWRWCQPTPFDEHLTATTTSHRAVIYAIRMRPDLGSGERSSCFQYIGPPTILYVFRTAQRSIITNSLISLFYLKFRFFSEIMKEGLLTNVGGFPVYNSEEVCFSGRRLRTKDAHYPAPMTTLLPDTRNIGTACTISTICRPSRNSIRLARLQRSDDESDAPNVGRKPLQSHIAKNNARRSRTAVACVTTPKTYLAG